MNAFFLPLKNVKKKLARTISLIVLLAVLAFTVFGGSIVISSLQRGLHSLEDRLGADIMVVPEDAGSDSSLESILLQGVPGYFYMDKSYAEQAAQVPGVGELTTQYFLASASAGCCSVAVQIYGFDPERDFSIHPWVSRSFTGTLQDGQVLAGCNIDADPGEDIRFFEQSLKIVEKLDRTGTEMDNAVYTTIPTVQRLIQASVDKGFNDLNRNNPEDLISAVLIRVQDGYTIDEVASNLALQLKGAQVVPTKSLLTGTSANLARVSRIIGILIAAIWILAVLIMVIAFTLLSNERRREFAILRVAGASRAMLSGMVLRESVLLSLAGGLLGVLLGAAVVFPFSHLIEQQMGLPYLQPGVGKILLFAVVTLLLTLVIGPLTSAIAAHRLSRIDIGQVLREEN